MQFFFILLPHSYGCNFCLFGVLKKSESEIESELARTNTLSLFPHTHSHTHTFLELPKTSLALMMNYLGSVKVLVATFFLKKMSFLAELQPGVQKPDGLTTFGQLY